MHFGLIGAPQRQGEVDRLSGRLRESVQSRRVLVIDIPGSGLPA